MRIRENISEAIGTDAFLDIVANLVGILLILIMVIGVRMKDASEEAVQVVSTPQPILVPEPIRVELPPVTIPDSEPAKLELSRLTRSTQDADREATELAQQMQVKKLDRDNLMLAITKAEHELTRRRAALDDEQQANLDSDLRLASAKEELQGVLQQLEFSEAQAAEKKSEVLQHLATPLAQTVFVREEHFRLKDGLLTYVPLNEMTKQLRSEAPKKMWKLENARQVTESIGPYQGFQLRYTLRRNRVPHQTESGMRTVREVVELDRFVMVPDGSIAGETVTEALKPTSAFRSRLSTWDPRETVVTVWTYPESFQSFRMLKGELYKIGFLTAARPLPDNQLISGSPSGTRSAAQ